MHTGSDTARNIRTCVVAHNYTAARVAVLHAAREGRAQLLPAWARNNNTARVLIDGEDVGQASTLCLYVREVAEVGWGTFVTRRLEPERDIFLPNHLKS